MCGSIPAMNCLNCALAATCEPYNGQNFSVQEFNLPLGKPFSSKDLPSKESFSSWRRDEPYSWKRAEPSFCDALSANKPFNVMSGQKKQVPKFIALEKTEMCHFLDDYGSCPYGDRCQYAHRECELRTVSRHPKYKTQVCRQFAQNGHCPYGRRCQFLHEKKEETKNTPQNNYKNNNSYNKSQGEYKFTLTFKPNQKASEISKANNMIKSEQNQVLSNQIDDVDVKVDGNGDDKGVGRLPVFVLLSQGILPKSVNL